MNWLQGGPYYELSFLVRTKVDKEGLLKEILEQMTRRKKFKIMESSNRLIEKVKSFAEGYEDEGTVQRSIDLNTEIEIEGIRKSRLFITELSTELMKVDLCFYGSEYDAKDWNQIGIKEYHKPEFRKLFQNIRRELNPILGTIAYEEDCSALFDTQELIPSEHYQLQNLNLDSIYRIVNLKPREFEYCWIGEGQIGNKSEIEIETG